VSVTIITTGILGAGGAVNVLVGSAARVASFVAS